MSTDNQNIPEEIDLIKLKQSISNAINRLILNTFLFFKKNVYKFVIIITSGIVLGVFLDNYFKNYLAEIVVNSNFTNNEYLYSKIDKLNSEFGIKVKNKDLLKEVPNVEKFSKIQVEPIVDIYAFVNNQAFANNAQNSQNFEMLKLMSENGDINKIIKDQITSKNYQLQKINLFSKTKVSEKDVKSIIKYLNKDPYFDSILNLNIKNIRDRISKNDSTVKQIDDLIKSYSISLAKGNANVLIKNENTEVNNLIDQKNSLIRIIEDDKLSLVTKNKIIRENTIVINQTNDKGIANKLKFILPIIFILLFLIYNYIMYLNRKSKNINI